LKTSKLWENPFKESTQYGLIKIIEEKKLNQMKRV